MKISNNKDTSLENQMLGTNNIPLYCNGTFESMILHRDPVWRDISLGSPEVDPNPNYPWGPL